MATRRVRIGERRHLVSLDNPTSVSTSEGMTQTWAPLDPPEMFAAIQPAAARELERVVANAVQSNATHIITINYHPQVTTQTRVTKGPRNPDGSLPSESVEFHVTGVQNPDFRNEILILVCEQVVQ